MGIETKEENEMKNTDKFKDTFGDYIQAVEMDDGRIDFNVSGAPWINPKQAIEFAKQLIELAEGME